MINISSYQSPLGEMLLACDEEGLSGAWFVEQKYFPSSILATARPFEHPILLETKQWLDDYFQGNRPADMPSLHLQGTDFRLRVWNQLLQIPYGETITYGQLASQLNMRMSAQAIGGAVSHNPISIIVPCHRVLGADGSLIGYAGGITRKQALLHLEGVITK